MGSAQGVILKCGELPRAFSFGTPTASVSYTTSGQSSLALYKESTYGALQATVNGTGAVTATVVIQGSNDLNTGQGFTPGGTNAPGGFSVNLNASTTLVCLANQFTQAMVGAEVRCVGVPVGTTVSAVAANGGSLTMSAAATITAVNQQAQLFDLMWVATPLGTITLSGTGKVSDGFQTVASWRYLRAVVSNVTGSNATVTVLMGV